MILSIYYRSHDGHIDQVESKETTLDRAIAQGKAYIMVAGCTVSIKDEDGVDIVYLEQKTRGGPIEFIDVQALPVGEGEEPDDLGDEDDDEEWEIELDPDLEREIFEDDNEDTE